MTSLATLAELKARLEWTLDADEERIADAALEDLSEDARLYGLEQWQPSAVPRAVVTTILQAAARFMRNPDGYEVSRAGDETLQWGQRQAESGSAFFTDREIKKIERLAKSPGFGSFGSYAWNNRPVSDGIGYVPVQGGGDMFPLFASSDDPW